MSASHTPGPWCVVESKLAGYGDNGANFSITAEDEVVAKLPLCHKLLDYGETASYLEARANACLIAAAPELLEALTLAEDVLSRFPFSSEIWPDGTHPNTGLTIIRAAIAKAEGNQP